MAVRPSERGRSHVYRRPPMIYLLMTAEGWEAARGGQEVAVPGAGGFVHCCDERQIDAVVADVFPAGVAVVALAIDPTRLEAETRYEPGSRGEDERFPHVFGPIEVADVREERRV